MFTTANHANQSTQQHYSPQNTHQPNGHPTPRHQNGAQPPQPSPSQPHRQNQAAQPKETIHVVGIPAVSIQNGKLAVGDSQSSSHRSYTPVKTLGDGSFGTVLLCDWHGTLPPNTPLSPMQCGGGARPEWAGKRLVAVKRMKKKWEGGWDECKKLKELQSLRAIPFHPCIIPLYDFFILPDTKELYFVFESMEGNLYHLIRARKGRPLAGGLVALIFRQIVEGLSHIHNWGYFHRDMKPENVLVTTTGLFEYRSLSPIAAPNTTEKDVVAIIKLADFGLAREITSAPPYTEYVSTRWYRAPEVLLMNRDYSTPVDMWALGTIMAELVNLRPLFPGSNQGDQIARVCEVLGDPAEDYGFDSRGKAIGGGRWDHGVRTAREQYGFVFPKTTPRDIYSYFERSVPRRLIECISDLLKYDPDRRLTSQDCLDHPYLAEALPRNTPPMPPALQVQVGPATLSRTSLPSGVHPLTPGTSPRNIPPSHSHSSLPRSSPRHPFSAFKGNGGARNHAQGSDIQEEARTNGAPPIHWPASHQRMESDQMELSPQNDHPPDILGHGQPMTDIQPSPMTQEYPARTRIDSDPQPMASQDGAQSHGNKLSSKISLSFGKKQSKWSFGFGHHDKGQQQHLPPVDEVPITSTSTSSLRRTQSTASDSASLADVDMPPKDPKARRKEAERVQREAEKQRRARAEQTQREQARAVMEKRNQLLMNNAAGNELEWKWAHTGSLVNRNGSNADGMKGKKSSSGPIRQNQGQSMPKVSSPTLSAAAGRYHNPGDNTLSPGDRWRDERKARAWRISVDDDHSVSSSDMHSTGRASVASFGTVDSDPGPSRVRRANYPINRMTSASSLRTGTTSFDDFPISARSSNMSLQHQFVDNLNLRTSVDTTSSVSGTSSPPPINLLSLSPSPHSWMQAQNHQDSANPTYVVPSIIQYPPTSQKPYEGQLYGHPPSPGIEPHSATINPIFKVPPLPSSPTEQFSSPHSLPPFAQLEAVAEGEYPPLSPMSFQSPDDESS
ncbi:Pkinase-domain-containing protein [Coniophora puteana RWD-64-598 SS2]|uniref:Pkinase-domain-containing protein n=1 Tax=Coniophora puteana (strain RWD-64-598) TaxID=741705 RepID=A0A5M3N5S6_CONPW|nr:Pkinase-domain-containing protein [Coniophora puteana RWD-64-598 SS2]EIW86733.1 Pkinase-domain-containing protein [Coniophora puteana RWD-64-598 SS2]